MIYVRLKSGANRDVEVEHTPSTHQYKQWNPIPHAAEPNSAEYQPTGCPLGTISEYAFNPDFVTQWRSTMIFHLPPKQTFVSFNSAAQFPIPYILYIKLDIQ